MAKKVAQDSTKVAQDFSPVRQTRPYFIIYAILMVCTYLTWQVAYVDLGEVVRSYFDWRIVYYFNLDALNTVVALAIAVFKAMLVVLFFMHVRQTRLAWVVVAAGIFWLGILLTLTMSDYLTRGWLTGGGMVR